MKETAEGEAPSTDPPPEGAGSPAWLLYGAYGFTGRRIARRAVEEGLRPVLAGRRRDPTEALAGELGLEHRVFSLDGPATVRSGLDGVALVLNAAGPFSRTWRAVAEACLDGGRHYLDITGEIEVFEGLASLDGRAREEGVLLMPGVGFDVVPTDSAAARVAERLDDPVRLDLAIASSGGPSRGTARTMLEALGGPSRIRRDGRIADVPHGALTRAIPFGDRERHGVCIPWGDVSTAYRTTGIPNIRVFAAVPRRLARWIGLLRLVLAPAAVRRAADWIVERTVEGPDEEELRRGRNRVWAEATDGTGERARTELITPSGYLFTARSAVAVVRRLLVDGKADDVPGFRTPASVFGPDFVEEIEGVERAGDGPPAG